MTLKTFKLLTKHKKRLLCFAGLIALASVGLVISSSKTHVLEQKPTSPVYQVEIEDKPLDPFKEKISKTLLSINKRLSSIQQEIKRATHQNKEDDLNLALKQLAQTITHFKAEAETSLLKNHEENEILAKKISALEKAIASLKGEQHPIQYLDKKELPFDVLAIDSVNDSPLLALRYNHNQLALEAGDALAGWKLIHLDYAKQCAEFEDEKGAHVVLSLNPNKKEKTSWA